MEEYLLFHSTDAGQQWSLIHPLGSNINTFPVALGQSVMRFWTPTDGLIVESSMVYPHELLVYRTTDTGTTWHLNIHLGPHQQIAHGNTHLSLTDRKGTLEIAMQLLSGQVFHVTSSNGGETWNAL